MNQKEFIGEVRRKQGIPGGWPKCFSFEIEGELAKVSLNSFEYYRVDPWSFAFFEEAKTNIPTVRSLAIDVKDSDKKPEIESLKRRLSYLTINQDPSAPFSVSFSISGKEEQLYSLESIFLKGSDEVIRKEQNRRGDDDQGERLEKDFQAFLYGKGFKNRRNDRLAILGDDFFRVKQKNYFIIREFATGVFRGKVSKRTRILPTRFIDLVSVNKYGELAIIELKIDDTKLELMSQACDYFLYVRKYLDDFFLQVSETSGVAVRNKKFVFYIVNNRYHEKMPLIYPYYKPRLNYGFSLKKVTLGFYE
jgi:hypothetical protein